MDGIHKVVESLRKAMIEADKLTLLNLVADELSYGHASGTIEDKTSFISSIITGNNKYKAIEVSGETVKIVDDVGIVRHRFKAEVLINGKPFSADINVMQVWQRQQDEWKLLARQAFKV